MNRDYALRPELFGQPIPRQAQEAPRRDIKIKMSPYELPWNKQSEKSTIAAAFGRDIGIGLLVISTTENCHRIYCGGVRVVSRGRAGRQAVSSAPSTVPAPKDSRDLDATADRRAALCVDILCRNQFGACGPSGEVVLRGPAWRRDRHGGPR
jgi:hypothetical protein